MVCRITNPEVYANSEERKLKLRQIIDKGDSAEHAREFLLDYFKEASDYYYNALLDEKCDIQDTVAHLRATNALKIEIENRIKSALAAKAKLISLNAR